MGLSRRKRRRLLTALENLVRAEVTDAINSECVSELPSFPFQTIFPIHFISFSNIHRRELEETSRHRMWSEIGEFWNFVSNNSRSTNSTLFFCSELFVIIVEMANEFEFSSSLVAPRERCFVSIFWEANKKGEMTWIYSHLEWRRETRYEISYESRDSFDSGCFQAQANHRSKEQKPEMSRRDIWYEYLIKNIR